MQFLIMTLVAVMLPQQAYANLQDIIHTFLHKNSNLNLVRSELEMNTLNYDAKLASKGWILSLNAQKADSTLEDTYTFTPTQNDLGGVDLSLSKDFFWGGSFSFNNELNVNETKLLGKKSYFSQNLAYSQDILSNFLGRNDKLELELIKKQTSAQKENLNIEEESQVLNLINLYSDAYESKSLIELYKSAYRRSVKREKLIKNRVKDGLNQKADFFSATGAKLLKLEELENIKLKHKYDLSVLSKLLHRNVESSEIKKFIYKYELKNKFNKNKTLKQLIERTALEKMRLKLINNETLPSLEVTGAYKTNDYDNLRSEALSKGNLTGDNSSLAIGVNLVWQIGSESASIKKRKTTILLENMNYQKMQLLENLKLSHDILLKQIAVKKNNLRSGKKRLNLARKILKEYIKLYKRSKADLDQIIRAEESLIETSKGLLHSQMEIKKLEFSFAALNGELLESIFGTNK